MFKRWPATVGGCQQLSFNPLSSLATSMLMLPSINCSYLHGRGPNEAFLQFDLPQTADPTCNPTSTSTIPTRSSVRLGLGQTAPAPCFRQCAYKYATQHYRCYVCMSSMLLSAPVLSVDVKCRSVKAWLQHMYRTANNNSHHVKPALLHAGAHRNRMTTGSTAVTKASRIIVASHC